MKVGINIQSYVDVITNSSTTVFCSIESDFETIIQNIEAAVILSSLRSLFNYEVHEDR